MNHTISKLENMTVELPNKVTGELVSFDNETYYKISNSDEMRPFFMSIVSDSNHWMFISSNGGLTAGRKNSEYALFGVINNFLPESLKIMGIIGILALIMSSADSTLHAGGVLFSHDVLTPIFKKFGIKVNELTLARIVTLVFGLIAILIS